MQRSKPLREALRLAFNDLCNPRRRGESLSRREANSNVAGDGIRETHVRLVTVEKE